MIRLRQKTWKQRTILTLVPTSTRQFVSYVDECGPCCSDLTQVLRDNFGGPTNLWIMPSHDGGWNVFQEGSFPLSLLGSTGKRNWTSAKDADPSNINIAPNTSNTPSSFTANNHVPVAVGSALQHALAGDSSKDPKGKADGEHENEHDAVVGSSSTSTSSSANAVAIEQSLSMSEERNENDLTNIRRPVILFAGEHTTPYHPSTIHGAFSSVPGPLKNSLDIDAHPFPEKEENGRNMWTMANVRELRTTSFRVTYWDRENNGRSRRSLVLIVCR
eukprot:scaffold49349_cov36-Attheya_sp.AAC.4